MISVRDLILKIVNADYALWRQVEQMISVRDLILKMVNADYALWRQVEHDDLRK